MSSRLLCVTIALFFIGAVAFAGEPDLEYHSTFYIYSFFWDNADFNENTEDGDQFYYLHGDIGLTADFGAGVSTNLTVGGWGTFGKHPITGEESAHGTPGQNVEVREAYVTVANLFDSPISFRAGKEHMLYGEQVFDGGEDGVTGLKFFAQTDAVDADFFWYRLVEGGGCACVGAFDTLPVPDDWDLFGTWITAKVAEGKVKIAPYGFYRTRDDASPMWLGARLDAAPIEGLNLAGEFTMMMGEDAAETDYAGMHYMAKLSYTPAALPVTFGGAYVNLTANDVDTDDNELYESPIWGPYTFGFYKWWPGFGPAHLQRTAFGFALVAPWEEMVAGLNVINGNIGFTNGPLSLRGDFFMYKKNEAAETDMGQEIALMATYTYEETITFGFTGGYWTPGDYFAGEDAMLGGSIFTYLSF